MITNKTDRLNDNYKPDQKAESAPNSDKAKKAKGAFRTISEVADDLGVQQHVLRFWETKFSQIRPLKRGGGRRYYRPEDVAVLKRIYELLYTEGYTIKGVQKLFRANGKQSVMEGEVGGAANTDVSIDVKEDETQAKAQPIEDRAEEASAPDEEIAVAQPVIKQGLSDMQKNRLYAALSELKELRALVSAE